MKEKQSKYASYGNLKHGLKNTPLYERWKGMRARCNNKNHRWYKNYGGKGIKVCERWNNFELFHLDMYPSFIDHIKTHGKTNTSIDRLDNKKGYCPENCKWSTRKEQNKNRSNIKLYKYNGEYKNLAEWGKIFNVKYLFLYSRIKKGKKLKQILELIDKNL